VNETKKANSTDFRDTLANGTTGNLAFSKLNYSTQENAK